jgi:hypothetical protein
MAGPHACSQMNTETNEMTHLVAGQGDCYLTACLLASGSVQLLVSVATNGQLLTYSDLGSKVLVHRLHLTVDQLTAAAAARETPAVVVGDRDGTCQVVSFLSPQQPRVVARVRACRKAVEHIVVACEHVIVAGDNALLVFNVRGH